MKNYLNNINERHPHDRRMHAMRLAAGITAAFLVVWFATLGLRLATAPQVATSAEDSSQAASAAQAFGSGNATLLVSTTTNY